MVETSQKPRTVWRIVLVLSLALNLLIAGLVVGGVASGRFQDGPPRNFSFGVGPMAAALSPQERRQLGRSLREDRVLRDVNLRGRVTAITSVLRSDPFDADAFADLLANQGAQVARMQESAQNALTATIAAMTPERRQAFADQVEQEMAKARQRPPRPNSGG